MRCPMSRPVCTVSGSGTYYTPLRPERATIWGEQKEKRTSAVIVGADRSQATVEPQRLPKILARPQDSRWVTDTNERAALAA